jgi:hypothetical protein
LHRTQAQNPFHTAIPLQSQHKAIHLLGQAISMIAQAIRFAQTPPMVCAHQNSSSGPISEIGIGEVQYGPQRRLNRAQ